MFLNKKEEAGRYSNFSWNAVTAEGQLYMIHIMFTANSSSTRQISSIFELALIEARNLSLKYKGM
jgi:hypothetical protein